MGILRIPRDVPLRVYIKRLIDADEVEKFYQTDEWKELKEEVLRDFHNECQECLKLGRVSTSESYRIFKTSPFSNIFTMLDACVPFA